jgi:hypothetical protein
MTNVKFLEPFREIKGKISSYNGEWALSNTTLQMYDKIHKHRYILWQEDGAFAQDGTRDHQSETCKFREEVVPNANLIEIELVDGSLYFICFSDVETWALLELMITPTIDNE